MGSNHAAFRWLDLDVLARAGGSELAGRRVLVTGATGFIGAALLHALAALGGKDLFALRRRSSDTSRLRSVPGSLHFVEADLRNAGEVREAIRRTRPQVVFHCAVYGGIHGQIDADVIHATTVEGTANLLTALEEEGGCDLLVNSGSSSEYGVTDEPMRETQRLGTTSGYGAAKAAATMLCQAAHVRGRIATATVRPFSAYGPLEDQGRLLPSLLRALVAGEAPKVGSGRQPRDWIYVGDLVELYFRVATQPSARGLVFNGGGGRDATVRQMVEAAVAEVARTTGRRIEPAWGALTDRPDEPPRWRADMTRAADLLGFRPRTDLHAGVACTVAFALDSPR
jgi:nucleoside-diphosphate-sugar epimerase